LEIGADIINDVSGGSFDNKMQNVIKKYNCPYILMHSRGTPQTMLNKKYLNYEDNFTEVLLKEINEKVEIFRQQGISE